MNVGSSGRTAIALTITSGRSHFTTLLLSIVLTLLALADLAKGQSQIKPSAIFDLSTAFSSTTTSFVSQAVAVSGKDILLLRTPTKSRVVAAQPQLIRVSPGGSIVSNNSLAVQGEPIEYALNKNGDVAVSTRLRDGTKQLELRIDTNSPEVVSFDRSLVASCGAIVISERSILPQSTVLSLSANGQLYTTSGGAITRLNDGRQTSPRFGFTAPVPSKCLLVTVDDSTIALVDKHSAFVKFLDLRTGKESTVEINAPEVTEALSRIKSITNRVSGEAPSASPVLFFEAASDSRGNLYLAVGPAPLSRGMQLVHIGPDRHYLGSIYLLPAALPRLKTSSNLSGLNVQRRLAISGTTFVTVSSDEVISVYPRAGGKQ